MDRLVNDRLELSVQDRGAHSKAWRQLRHWFQAHSIRVRLYSVFVLLFFLVTGLGVFGFSRLSDVDHASAVIRNHWLRDTGILGDLSNFMSDYRTAEATHLLSSTPVELAASAKELAQLGATVASSQRAYEEIPQGPEESRLYAQFAQQWAAYQAVAARVVALAQAGQTAEAVRLYNNESRRTFDLSSDTLSRLTDQTLVKARGDSEHAASTYVRAKSMILTAMVLAVCLLFGVIIYITRGILTPLLELATGMRALAAQNTDIFISGSGREDEIGEMARAVTIFRDNAVALANSQRRLIEQAAALEEGLENERRITAQQRDFVSMTSHEFRTPLTIIDGHAQRLIKTSERLEPADVAERGVRIRSAVQRITNIMDSLLGASRFLDGNMVFHPSDLNPASLLLDACQAHRDATRGAVIIEDYSSLPPAISGDSKLLFHAFSNLISNALKYSPVGSPIEVSAHQEQEWMVVEVRDHGIGIPARDRKRLFGRYFRGSNATGVAGTGVGLHLVAMVVSLHQGEVFAESLEGIGSRFIVRLPIHPGGLPGE
ncbi:MAG TPA: ATP-binding protein [Steroidobacteraceae bacterium]|nr:ATP-binding protein [Steroidobacteraceae bacterium]